MFNLAVIKCNLLINTRDVLLLIMTSCVSCVSCLSSSPINFLNQNLSTGRGRGGGGGAGFLVGGFVNNMEWLVIPGM